MGDRLVTMNTGRKEGAAKYTKAMDQEGADGSLSNTMWPGPSSTSIPSGILIHPAIWLQQSRAENWKAAVPRWGELGPHLTQCGRGRGLPPCQLSILIHPTVWPQYTNVTDRTDR